MYYANEVVEELRAGGQLALFGAGQVAFEVANCLMGKPYELKIDYCVVSQTEGNPDSVTGIPVIDLETAKKCLQKDAVILIATMEKYRIPIEDSLHKAGYSHILPLTFEGDLWSDIQGNYYRDYRLANGKPYLTLEEEIKKTETEREERPSISIYAVKCHVDKPLREDMSLFLCEI